MKQVKENRGQRLGMILDLTPALAVQDGSEMRVHLEVPIMGVICGAVIGME